LDKTIETNDIPKLQQIEGRLLEYTRDSFEMIGTRECEDLERIRTDRHLCAHPAFTKESLLFNPSPELVRAHILHVITHVLQPVPIGSARKELDLAAG